MISDSLLDTIGHTPVVRLRRLTVAGCEILVKLEGANPGGSIKDRSALSMVDQAERDGLLSPGGAIVESTSGNVGKALALIGAVRGYRIILVVDRRAPQTMLNYAAALGAEIVMVEEPDATGSFQGARIERVKALLAGIPGAFWPDQYNNPANPRAHAETTGHEVLADVADFDTLVTAVGTGGHISGISATVKRGRPEVVTVGVDVIGSSTFGFPFGTWATRGIGLGWHPGCLNRSVIDRVHMVADHEGFATCRLLARAEGILVGESAGAAVFGALHHAHLHPGSRIVVVAADSGANYLGETFDDDWLRARGTLGEIERAGLVDVHSVVAAARTPVRPAMPEQEANADNLLVRTV
jgi:cystathionine beta-synthase/cysteine synthase A